MTARDQTLAAAGDQARHDLSLQPASEEPVEEPSASYQAWLSKYLKGPHLHRPPDRVQVQAEIERLDRKVEQMESRKKHAPSELDLERAERRISAFEDQAAALRSSLEPHPEADLPECGHCGAVLDDADYFCFCRRSSSSTSHERNIR